MNRRSTYAVFSRMSSVRLGRGAKVRDFLHVLATSNVRAMLRAVDKALWIK